MFFHTATKDFNSSLRPVQPGPISKLLAKHYHNNIIMGRTRLPVCISQRENFPSGKEYYEEKEKTTKRTEIRYYNLAPRQVESRKTIIICYHTMWSWVLYLVNIDPNRVSSKPAVTQTRDSVKFVEEGNSLPNLETTRGSADLEV